MLLVPRHGEKLERLVRRIRLADAPSCSLVDDIAAACDRFAMLRRAGKTGHFDAWCKSGAWVEATLALAANELPAWSVRRIVCDSGIWSCSLSRSPNLPIEFDDSIEVSHESMPLAILLAVVEAKRLGSTAARLAVVPPAATAADCYRICCDNFA